MINPLSIHGDVETAETAALRAMMAYSRALQKAPAPSGIVVMSAGIFTLGAAGIMLSLSLAKWRNMSRSRPVSVGPCV
jgi:hypothetical protein